jgi:LysM repeat protein
VKKFIFVLIIFVYATLSSLKGQEAVDLTKSGIIEEINGKKYYIHIVKPGTTLYSLARVYNVSIDELETNNPGVKNGLSINQQLKIPFVSNSGIDMNEVDVSNAEFTYHDVEEGETLYSISKKHNVSIDEIRHLNPVVVAKGIENGMSLKIPVKPGNSDKMIRPNTIPDDDTLKGYFYHTIQKGETLYGLTREYEVSVEKLTALNPEIRDGFKVGQKILIPEKLVLPPDIIEIKRDSVVYYIVHKVRRKETLYSLSKAYDVSIDDLFLLNPILEDGLKKKQLIKIPVRDETAYPNVRSGVLVVFSFKMPEKEEVVIVKPKCYDYEYTGRTISVAMLLPLYLEEITGYNYYDSARIITSGNLKAFRFLQFYEGALMAIDALVNKGLNIKLFVYDVDGSRGKSKTQSVIRDPELRNMDLIIGPLYYNSFKVVAEFAESHSIPIINPFSRKDKILYNNTNVYKVQPSWEEQLRQTANFIKLNYPDANIIIVRQNQYQNKPELGILKQEFLKIEHKGIRENNEREFSMIIDITENEEILLEDILIDSLTSVNALFYRKNLEQFLSDSSDYYFVREIIFNTDSLYGIRKVASPVRKNIVITLSKNQVFISDFITRLNNIRGNYDISLFGYPDWEDYDLEPEYMLNLDLHLFSTSFVDYENLKVKEFIYDFRRRYNCEPEPDRYAFRGYDICYYFIDAIFRYGKDFGECIYEYEYSGLSTSFEFLREDENYGYENQSIRVYKFANYKRIELK